MEREFILYSSKGFTAPFDLNDLTKGRMDLVARCISAAFFISYGIRENTIFHVFLNGPPDPPRQITLKGVKSMGFLPDEKSIAKRLNEILKFGENLELNKEIRIGNIKIAKKSFENFLKKLQGKKIIYLHRRGKDVRSYKFPEKFVVIVGGHRGLPQKTEKFLERLGADKVSLGRIEYSASHCITILHNELDRRFG